jgi:hypothetical protein
MVDISVELVGLVILVGGAVWWASAITSKMDVIIKLLSDHSDTFVSHDQRIDDHEHRITVLEQK